MHRALGRVKGLMSLKAILGENLQFSDSINPIESIGKREKIEFDLGLVKRIQSYQLREFIDTVKEFHKKHYEILYLRCPEIFLDHINMIPELLLGNDPSQMIDSVILTFNCRGCDRDDRVLVPFQKVVISLRSESRIIYPCGRCLASMAPAYDAHILFYFLSSQYQERYNRVRNPIAKGGIEQKIAMIRHDIKHRLQFISDSIEGNSNDQAAFRSIFQIERLLAALTTSQQANMQYLQKASIENFGAEMQEIANSRQKTCAINIDIPGEIGNFKIPNLIFEQVVFNLAINAIAYCKSEVRIDIKKVCESGQELLKVKIENDGDKSHVERITNALNPGQHSGGNPRYSAKNIGKVRGWGLQFVDQTLKNWKAPLAFEWHGGMNAFSFQLSSPGTETLIAKCSRIMFFLRIDEEKYMENKRRLIAYLSNKQIDAVVLEKGFLKIEKMTSDYGLAQKYVVITDDKSLLKQNLPNDVVVIWMPQYSAPESLLQKCKMLLESAST